MNRHVKPRRRWPFGRRREQPPPAPSFSPERQHAIRLITALQFRGILAEQDSDNGVLATHPTTGSQAAVVLAPHAGWNRDCWHYNTDNGFYLIAPPENVEYVADEISRTVREPRAPYRQQTHPAPEPDR